MKRLPAPLCCLRWWFTLVVLGVFGAAFWIGYRLPKAAPTITLIFHAFEPDGRSTKAYLVQVENQPWTPVATGVGCQLSRPEGTTFTLTFSRDQQLSDDDTKVRVQWRKTEAFRQWLQKEFLKENGLTATEQWNRNFQWLQQRTAGNKQYYPIVLRR